jgi:hypothetical protein
MVRRVVAPHGVCDAANGRYRSTESHRWRCTEPRRSYLWSSRPGAQCSRCPTVDVNRSGGGPVPPTTKRRDEGSYVRSSSKRQRRLEVLRELEKRNSSQALHGHYRQQAPGFCRSPGTTCILQEEHYLATPRARSRRNILSCRSDPDRLNLRLRGESRSASLRLN